MPFKYIRQYVIKNKINNVILSLFRQINWFYLLFMTALSSVLLFLALPSGIHYINLRNIKKLNRD